MTNAKKSAKPKLVKMVRDPNEYPEPHECECHPEMVEEYRAGGWQEAK